MKKDEEKGKRKTQDTKKKTSSEPRNQQNLQLSALQNNGIKHLS
jgi:hypothetical protein